MGWVGGRKGGEERESFREQGMDGRREQGMEAGREQGTVDRGTEGQWDEGNGDMVRVTDRDGRTDGEEGARGL